MCQNYGSGNPIDSETFQVDLGASCLVKVDPLRQKLPWLLAKEMAPLGATLLSGPMPGPNPSCSNKTTDRNWSKAVTCWCWFLSLEFEERSNSYRQKSSISQIHQSVKPAVSAPFITSHFVWSRGYVLQRHLCRWKVPQCQDMPSHPSSFQISSLTFFKQVTQLVRFYGKRGVLEGNFSVEPIQPSWLVCRKFNPNFLELNISFGWWTR